MPISSYSNFLSGVSIRGMPILNTYSGNVYYVNNSTTLPQDARAAADGGRGDMLHPFITLAYAITRCVSGRGDIIVVGPGHAETVASAGAITCSKSDVAIVGMGKGDDRPTFTMNTATTATFKITGQGVAIKDCIFVGNVASLATCVDVRAKNVLMEDCQVKEGASAQPLLGVLVGAAANDSDRFEMRRCEVYNPTAAAVSGVKINKALIGVRIRDCKFYGDYSDGAIANPSSAAQTDLLVDGGSIYNAHASAYGIRMQTTTGTGVVSNMVIRCDTQANAAVLGTITADRTVWSDLSSANKQAVSVNAAVANAATVGTALASTKSLVDAIGSDGTTISYGSGNVNAGVGSSYIFKKTLTSSAITQAGVTAVTASAALSIEQIIVQTDSTGLAAGTNFTLTHNNAKGLLVFAGAAVSALGANKTIALTAGAQPSMAPYTALESGSVVTAKCTTADCTGAGTVDVYFICKRITAGAALS